MCVIAVVGVAPCQCFSPGANQTTSPGRISSTGPPSRCAHPQPAMTISVCPKGCVCHAVRAPGSNVTLAPCTMAGSGAENSGSIRTVPVNQSAGPLVDGCEPTFLISIASSPRRSQVVLVVSRLLIESVPSVFDFQLVHPFHPILRLDLFHRYRNRLFPIVQDLDDVLGDGFGKTLLLLFRFSRPQLHDDVRHVLLLAFQVLTFARAHSDRCRACARANHGTEIRAALVFR